MTGSYVKEAIATMNAGWLELKLAKLFGKKSKHNEGTIIVKLSKFRDKTYLIDMVVNDPH